MVICFVTARPCTRCVKKGQGDQCCEGQRKKAKYLMTEAELGESNIIAVSHIPAPACLISSAPCAAEHNAKKRERARARKVPANPAVTPEGAATTTSVVRKSSTPAATLQNIPDLEDDMMTGGNSGSQELREPEFDLSLDQGFQFDSQAANLEYAVLDSIFADLPGLAEQNGVESFMNAWQGAAMGSQSMIGGNVPNQTTLNSDMMDFSIDAGSGVGVGTNVLPAPGTIGSIATQVSASSVYDLVSEP